MDAAWPPDDPAALIEAPIEYGGGDYAGPDPYAGGIGPDDPYNMANMAGMGAMDPGAGGDYEDDLAGHYADRFSDEGRERPARFGYDYDHPVGGAPRPPQGHSPGGGKKAAGGKRKRLWGRK
jgi:hypothetical protein